MVLESLLDPLRAERKPWENLFTGYVYSSVAIVLSLWIFRSQASLIMVFLTVMACLPIVYNTMRFEESKDLVIDKQRKLIIEHNKAIVFLMFLFIGVTLSFVTWYIFLPPDILSLVFDTQTDTIQSINNRVSGNTYYSVSVLSKIFLNNVKVLTFAILFSFIYGAGAIFILTWNASVIGTAIGNFIRSNLGQFVGAVGFEKAAGYFSVISIGLLRYTLHGIPEILAYFYGGLAGGIISVAVIKKHYKSKKFFNVLYDVSDLLILSIGFLVLAAFIEVFVTPLLF